MSLSIFIPPDVEPVQAPHSMSMIVRNSENEPQSSAPVIEKPVEVMADIMWKSG